MRLVHGNSADPRWYSEAGGTSWGFGFEVQHHGEPDGDTGEIRPEGWSLDIYLGPLLVSIFTERAAEAVFDESLQYMGAVTRI